LWPEGSALSPAIVCLEPELVEKKEGFRSGRFSPNKKRERMSEKGVKRGANKGNFRLAAPGL